MCMTIDKVKIDIILSTILGTTCSDLTQKSLGNT